MGRNSLVLGSVLGIVAWLKASGKQFSLWCSTTAGAAVQLPEEARQAVRRRCQHVVGVRPRAQAAHNRERSYHSNIKKVRTSGLQLGTL